MNRNSLIDTVQTVIKQLYTKDKDLINKDLCERCLVHRLAFYLQMLLPNFYVDCEFNKSFYKDRVNNKVLSNIHGNYVDIIVHKRSNNYGENLLCFEIKKANNRRDREKDRQNLRILTAPDRFAYLLGFYIILGKTIEETEVELYSNGGYVQKVLSYV